MLSIVIPVHDEADSVSPLLEELRSVLSKSALPYEVIFVDDGSADRTRHVLAGSLGSGDIRVAVLRRRRGKAAAIAAGLSLASGDLILTMDGDGQDDPAGIPALLERLETGADLVCGWRRQRRDPASKTLPSRVYNGLARILSGVPLHDLNCGLKLFRREVLDDVPLYGGLYRFLPLLAHQAGYRVEEVEVRHRPRRHGRSKYGGARFLQGFLDGLTFFFLTRFVSRPLHFFGALGLTALCVGIALDGYLSVLWFMGHPIGNRPLLLLGSLLIALGVQFLLLGLIAEMLARSLYRQEDPRRFIRTVLGPPAAAPRALTSL